MASVVLPERKVTLPVGKPACEVVAMIAVRLTWAPGATVLRLDCTVTVGEALVTVKLIADGVALG